MRVKEALGLELWRVPDIGGGDAAVWYGPAGPEGDVATAVAKTGAYRYRIGDVQNVEGLIDDPDGPFLVTAVSIDLDDAVQEALRIDGDAARERLDGLDEGTKLRMAAGLGAGFLSERGGDETWASSLKDGVAEIV